jgi:3D-(3,5/4)-trihydroxycyclohexane-1,2-dione acylhydrolase (decyclizing)
VIVCECDPARGVGAYESWWDVPVAEVSTMPPVQAARADYERERLRERPFTGGGHG